MLRQPNGLRRFIHGNGLRLVLGHQPNAFQIATIIHEAKVTKLRRERCKRPREDQVFKSEKKACCQDKVFDEAHDMQIDEDKTNHVMNKTNDVQYNDANAMELD